jgi:tight adherence protein C
LVERGPAGRRAKALLERRQMLAEAAIAPTRRGLAPKGLSLAREITRRFKLMGGAQARDAQLKLERAGLRSRDALTVYQACKLCLPLVFGLTTALFVIGFEILGPLPGILGLLISGLSVGIGYAAPDIYCRNLSDRRKQVMRRMLPDALDLMVICTEAGLNLDSSFQRVAREFRGGCPELADEFELAAVELGFLPERRDALMNLERRTDLPAMAALTGTLSQAERYGTPLAQSLRVLAAEVRDQRMMKAEEKAARLPAILTVPMVMFILPALFIVLIGPGILRTIDAMMSL